MARHRTFDDQHVRQSIMLLFWRRGYDSTSLADLEKATSLPRTSLYNAYGSKADMFALGLKDYHNVVEQQFDQAIEQYGLQAAAYAFQVLKIQNENDPAHPSGCLMVSAAAQHASVTDTHLALVQAFRAMLVSKFEKMLKIGQEANQIRPDFDLKSAADMLTCILWGAQVAQCADQDYSKNMFDADTLPTLIASWR